MDEVHDGEGSNPHNVNTGRVPNRSTAFCVVKIKVKKKTGEPGDGLIVCISFPTDYSLQDRHTKLSDI